MGLKKIKVAKKTPGKDAALLSLSERWDLWFEKNARYLIGGVVLLVALAGAVWGVTAYRESLEARARTEYVALLGKLPVADGESPRRMGKRIRSSMPTFRRIREQNRHQCPGRPAAGVHESRRYEMRSGRAPELKEIDPARTRCGRLPGAVGHRLRCRRQDRRRAATME